MTEDPVAKPVPPVVDGGPVGHDEHEVGPPPAPLGVGASGLLVLVVVALLGTLVYVGLRPRLAKQQAVVQTQKESSAPPRVVVGVASAGPKQVDLALPANAQPFQKTPIFARASGFVKSLKVDLGDKVEAGDLLVELDIPESEQELLLAKAKQDEAQANAALAKARAERLAKLAKDGIGTQQDLEDQQAKANSAAAAVKTTKADLTRLGVLQAYRRVVAPFDGVIVRRSVDVGALVNAGSGPTATVLFELQDVSFLRVQVDVPQSLAASVKIGTKATVSLPNNAGKAVEGEVFRTAGALDVGTRTLRVEVKIPGTGAILAGAFVQVRFQLQVESPPTVIPASALAVRKEGPFVVRLMPDDTVVLVPITLGRDLGKQIEALTGVKPGELLLMSPPDYLQTGAKVRRAEPTANH